MTVHRRIISHPLTTVHVYTILHSVAELLLNLVGERSGVVGKMLLSTGYRHGGDPLAACGRTPTSAKDRVVSPISWKANVPSRELFSKIASSFCSADHPPPPPPSILDVKRPDGYKKKINASSLIEIQGMHQDLHQMGGSLQYEVEGRAPAYFSPRSRILSSPLIQIVPAAVLFTDFMASFFRSQVLIFPFGARNCFFIPSFLFSEKAGVL